MCRSKPLTPHSHARVSSKGLWLGPRALQDITGTCPRAASRGGVQVISCEAQGPGRNPALSMRGVVVHFAITSYNSAPLHPAGASNGLLHSSLPKGNLRPGLNP
jgi:hypothetical protein